LAEPWLGGVNGEGLVKLLELSVVPPVYSEGFIALEGQFDAFDYFVAVEAD